MNAQWGTVAAGKKIWSHSNIEVLCRYHGYETTSKFRFQAKLNIYGFVIGDSARNATDSSMIPQSLSKPVHLQDVVCSGNELELLECQFKPYNGVFNDANDIIIKCQKGKVQQSFSLSIEALACSCNSIMQ